MSRRLLGFFEVLYRLMWVLFSHSIRVAGFILVWRGTLLVMAERGFGEHNSAYSAIYHITITSNVSMSRQTRMLFQNCFAILISCYFVLCNSLSLLPEDVLQTYGIQKQQDEESTAFRLSYNIFEGTSALRELPESCQQMMARKDVNKAGKALLLLLAGYGDAAHDVLLSFIITRRI